MPARADCSGATDDATVVVVKHNFTLSAAAPAPKTVCKASDKAPFTVDVTYGGELDFSDVKASGALCGNATDAEGNVARFTCQVGPSAQLQTVTFSATKHGARARA